MIIKRQGFKLAASQALLLWFWNIFDCEVQHFLNRILLEGSHGIKKKWRKRREVDFQVGNKMGQKVDDALLSNEQRTRRGGGATAQN